MILPADTPLGMECDRPPPTFSLVDMRGHTLPLRGLRRRPADTGVS